MSSANLVSKLTAEEEILARHALNCISPDDAKYGKTSKKLREYLSAAAEWHGCAYVQKVLLETRVEFGQAEQWNLNEVTDALTKIDPLNMALVEDAPPEKGGTRHDQLAVIEEIGRFVSEETKALLHPGTTSYDILDTARSYLFKNAWNNVIRPELVTTIMTLCDLTDRSATILQTGRTHLQNTSPIMFGSTTGSYAARIAKRLVKIDECFNDLRGKISGIVGTGASIDMVIGEGTSIVFEKRTLKKLGLEPDYTATQIVQKESLADVGNSLTTLMYVLGDFANDMRILYSSAINEVTSRDNAARLGGSSADAMKNNPIDYENIAGTPPIVESGMRILYAMIPSDLQRDLRNSKQGRYQPQSMMTETYESITRLNKALLQLSINEDTVAKNLEPVRKNPSEAMVAILRGEKWVHSQYGVGHDFVKEMGKRAKKQSRNLLEVSREDTEFKTLYTNLSENKKDILNGQLEKYTGSAVERMQINAGYAKSICKGA